MTGEPVQGWPAPVIFRINLASAPRTGTRQRGGATIQTGAAAVACVVVGDLEVAVEGESVGTVVRWSTKKGLGGIDSPDTPGGCWVHFTHVLAGGDQYRALEVGQVVLFGYEEVEQDGYPFRATWVGSHAPGQVPRPDPGAHREPTTPSQAYTSTLRLTYDDGEGEAVP